MHDACTGSRAESRDPVDWNSVEWRTDDHATTDRTDNGDGRSCSDVEKSDDVTVECDENTLFGVYAVWTIDNRRTTTDGRTRDRKTSPLDGDAYHTDFTRYPQKNSTVYFVIVDWKTKKHFFQHRKWYVCKRLFIEKPSDAQCSVHVFLLQLSRLNCIYKYLIAFY